MMRFLEKLVILVILISGIAHAAQESLNGNDVAFVQSLVALVESKNLPAVEFLLAKGIFIDQRDYRDYTALMIAAQNGELEIVSLLVRSGASIEAQNNNDKCNTPLFYAIEKKHLSVVQFLLDNGAFVDHKNNDGDTPLFIAVREEHLAIIQLLLAKGASVNMQNDACDTPFIIAADNGDLLAVRLLLKNNAFADYQDPNGHTALILAATEGNLPMVRVLLEKGAQVDLKDNDGDSPLLCAAIHGKINAIKILLENGASITHANNKNQTLISLLPDMGNQTVLPLLTYLFANSDRFPQIFPLNLNRILSPNQHEYVSVYINRLIDFSAETSFYHRMHIFAAQIKDMLNIELQAGRFDKFTQIYKKIFDEKIKDTSSSKKPKKSPYFSLLFSEDEMAKEICTLIQNLTFEATSKTIENLNDLRTSLSFTNGGGTYELSNDITELIQDLLIRVCTLISLEFKLEALVIPEGNNPLSEAFRKGYLKLAVHLIIRRPQLLISNEQTQIGLASYPLLLKKLIELDTNRPGEIVYPKPK